MSAWQVRVEWNMSSKDNVATGVSVDGRARGRGAASRGKGGPVFLSCEPIVKQCPQPTAWGFSDWSLYGPLRLCYADDELGEASI